MSSSQQPRSGVSGSKTSSTNTQSLDIKDGATPGTTRMYSLWDDVDPQEVKKNLGIK